MKAHLFNNNIWCFCWLSKKLPENCHFFSQKWIKKWHFFKNVQMTIVLKWHFWSFESLKKMFFHFFFLFHFSYRSVRTIWVFRFCFVNFQKWWWVCINFAAKSKIILNIFYPFQNIYPISKNLRLWKSSPLFLW